LAIYVINRLPMPLLDSHCPFEILFHKVPDYYFLHVFVYECFATLLMQQHKLALCSKKCIFMVMLPIINGVSV